MGSSRYQVHLTASARVTHAYVRSCTCEYQPLRTIHVCLGFTIVCLFVLIEGHGK